MSHFYQGQKTMPLPMSYFTLKLFEMVVCTLAVQQVIIYIAKPFYLFLLGH